MTPSHCPAHGSHWRSGTWPGTACVPWPPWAGCALRPTPWRLWTLLPTRCGDLVDLMVRLAEESRAAAANDPLDGRHRRRLVRLHAVDDPVVDLSSLVPGIRPHFSPIPTGTWRRPSARRTAAGWQRATFSRPGGRPVRRDPDRPLHQRTRARGHRTMTRASHAGHTGPAGCIHAGGLRRGDLRAVVRASRGERCPPARPDLRTARRPGRLLDLPQ